MAESPGYWKAEHALAMREVASLEARVTRLRKILVDVRDAWEALPGRRNYRPSEVQDWLVEDMKPAMDALRAALKDIPDAKGEK